MINTIDDNIYKFASVSLETFALLVTTLLLVSNFLMREMYDQRSRLFTGMLITNAVALLCDVITWLGEEPGNTSLMYAANFFVFSLGYVMTALFTAYLGSFIVQKTSVDQRIIYGNYGLSALSVTLVGVSLFNGMFFYVEDGYLQFGYLDWLSILLTLVMILLDMVLMLLHRKEFGIKNTMAFLSYGVFPMVAFLVQLTGTEMTVTWLASTLTMLLIYLMVHIGYVRELDHKEMELAQSRQKLAQSREQLRESQTALMISQIQPHFLYNSLTVVDQLIRTDPPLARKALAEFSTYLRCNLNSLKHNGLIPFSDELRHIRAYLKLEQMRYGEYLQVVYDIRTEDFDVPALSVQPLVENAVQHGLADRKEGGTVTIAARECEDCHIITVRDDGVGFAPGEAKGTGAHIGIENIRTRLSLMCGGTLTVKSEKGTGTEVSVIVYRK